MNSICLALEAPVDGNVLILLTLVSGEAFDKSS
jgi:hypothetical protein